MRRGWRYERIGLAERLLRDMPLSTAAALSLLWLPLRHRLHRLHIDIGRAHGDLLDLIDCRIRRVCWHLTLDIWLQSSLLVDCGWTSDCRLIVLVVSRGHPTCVTLDIALIGKLSGFVVVVHLHCIVLVGVDLIRNCLGSNSLLIVWILTVHG